MKVLFCIKALNNAGGGAERVLCNIANTLAERGHDIKILTFEKPGGQSFYPLNCEVKRLDIDIGDTVSNARVGETFRRVMALRRHIGKEKPDIAVGFMHSMFVPLALALLGTATPVLASEHIVPAHYRSRRLERLFLWLSSLFIRRLTVVSEQVKNDYPPIIRRKMTVVPNPVCLPDVATSPETRNEQCKLLSVGRLTDQKDHKTLVQAFSKIASRYPGWKLQIVGDGELRQEIEDLIGACGLNERVVITRYSKDIAKLYADATALVLPSKYESFGLAAAEALAKGMPVIAFSDCQGLNELVQHEKTGLLADAGENRVQSLTAVLERFAKDEALRYQLLRVPSKLPSRHLIANVADDWESLLQTVAD